jgi:hypothetical protein
MAEVTTTSRRPPRARKAAAPVVETQVSLRDRILAAMRELTAKAMRKPRGKTDVVAWGSLDPAVGFGDVDAYRDELAAMVEAGLLEEVGGGFRLGRPGEQAPAQVTEAERDAAALAAMERNVLAAIGPDGEATCGEIAVELGCDEAMAIVLVEGLLARRVLRKARSGKELVWYAVNGDDKSRLVAYLQLAGTYVSVEAMASQAVLTVERAEELACELVGECSAWRDPSGSGRLYRLRPRETVKVETPAAPEPTPPATVVEAPAPAPAKRARASKAAAPAPVAPPAPPADEDPRVAHLPVWLNSPDGHAAVPHRLAPASAVAVLPLLSPDQRSLAWLAANRAEMKSMLVAAGRTEATAATYAGNVAKAARCRLEAPDRTVETQLAEATEAIERWPALGRWLEPALAEATRAIKGGEVAR